MIEQLGVAHFKAFGQGQRAVLAPITLIYGPNSGGKSSLLQALLLLKQTNESGGAGSSNDLVTRGSLVNLGSFASLVHQHNRELRPRLELALQLPVGDLLRHPVSCSLGLTFGEAISDIHQVRAMAQLVAVDIRVQGLQLELELKHLPNAAGTASERVFRLTSVSSRQNLLATFGEWFDHPDDRTSSEDQPRSASGTDWSEDGSTRQGLHLMEVLEVAAHRARSAADEAAALAEYSLESMRETEARVEVWLRALEEAGHGTVPDDLVQDVERLRHHLGECCRTLASETFQALTTNGSDFRSWLSQQFNRMSGETFALGRIDAAREQGFLAELESNAEALLVAIRRQTVELDQWLAEREVALDSLDALRDLARVPGAEPTDPGSIADPGRLAHLMRRLDELASKQQQMISATGAMIAEAYGRIRTIGENMLSAVEPRTTPAPAVSEQARYSRLMEAAAELVFRCSNGLLPTSVGLEGHAAKPQRRVDALAEARAPDSDRDLLLELVQLLFSDIGRAWNHQLALINYLGPLRSPPERFFITTVAASHGVGTAGELTHAVLHRRGPKVRRQVNEWLERLEIPYEIRTMRLDDAVTGEIAANALVDRRTRVPVAPCDVGFGIGQLLPIVVQAVASTGQILCIEQPEIHLHPRLQAAVGDLIIETALTGDGDGVQWLVETHSEAMMLRLQRRIREGNLEADRVSVLYISRGDDGSQIQRLRLDESGEFVDEWPDGFFAERYHELLGDG